MAKTISGVSKSEVTVDSSIGADILIQMSKDYKDLLNTLKSKTTKSSKLDKDPVLDAKVNATIELLEKQLKEVTTLTERAKESEKLAKSTKLTDIQKKVLLEELQKDFTTTFGSFKDVPEELAGFMKDFRNVAGATDLKRTFDRISLMTKRVAEVAERNEKIDSARKKLRTDIIGDDWNSGIKGLGHKTLDSVVGSAVGILGPLSALVTPAIGFLKKEGSTIFTALKRKNTEVKVPTESALLKDGGTMGKGFVYLGRKIDGSSKEDKEGGLIKSLFGGESGGGIADSIGTAVAGSVGFRAVKNAVNGIRNRMLTTSGFGSVLKKGLTGVTIGVALEQLAEGVSKTLGDLISGKSAEESGEETANENNPWNPLYWLYNFGAGLGSALFGAGKGFSLGWDFGKNTSIPLAATTFGLYGAGIEAGDYFFDWFRGYSNSDAIKKVPVLGTAYSYYGNALDALWDGGRALQAWAAGDGGVALRAWQDRLMADSALRKEESAIRKNGGVPLDATGGLSDETLRELQLLWFFLQFDLDAAKRGQLLANLTSLGVSSSLIEGGLTPEEQTALVSDWVGMEDQMASLKREYSDLLLPSSEFDTIADQLAADLGIGTEDNPMVVALDEKSKQDIASDISKNSPNNFVFQTPLSLNFDFSGMRF